MTRADKQDAPLRTPLHALHAELGARMTVFAGYDMPLQYPRGILQEHLQTRSNCSLFDISHMGQIAVRPTGGGSDAARALERLVPADIVGLAHGRQRYALFTDEAGGILDDLMVANCGSRLFLVVNASRKEADEAHLRARLSGDCTIERLADRALLALQGPQAENVLASVAPGVRAMRFMDVIACDWNGAALVVSRSGYTGEDGFELSVPAGHAEPLARALLSDTRVAPAGLGARDSLRLEAGLCLYGADIDETTSPVEAALAWSIPKSRRRGGAREAGFPGADVILEQLERGVARKRVGLRAEGRMPVRGGALLFADAETSNGAGRVTSGGFGPSIDAPVAMGFVATEFARTGQRLFADVRGRRVAVQVCDLPFVAANYRRT